MMREPWGWSVTGPLAEQASGYRQELAGLGYSRWTALFHMHLMGHLSRWLDDNGMPPSELSEDSVDRFLTDRRASGYTTRLSPRGLIPLLGYLRGLGVVPEPVAPVPGGTRDRLLAEFVGHLAAERGLSERTIVGYRRVAATFLSGWCCEPPGDDLAGVTAEQVNAFVLAECGRRSVGSANNVVTSLRALMRFLYLHGHIAVPLADAVSAVASWRDGGRSKALEAGVVAALLASCDRRTAAGRRDFAILTVLARLGLRSAEVASLSLDDLDWRAGEVVVAGKGNRHDRLPLPVDVGKALADYCRRSRPRGHGRALFLHVRAPYAALSPSAVSHVVVRACRRAGVPEVRAHLLRHSTASAMRRAGAPLVEIGQVLRHHHTVTTALYAKDDLDALAAIARVWPGGQA